LLWCSEEAKSKSRKVGKSVIFDEVGEVLLELDGYTLLQHDKNCVYAPLNYTPLNDCAGELIAVEANHRRKTYFLICHAHFVKRPY
jgi:hypothetical protein